MRHIHPAAWAGLVLNGMLTFVLFADVNSGSSADIPAIAHEALEILRPVMLLLLGLQAVALGLIASKSKAGIVLAGFAGFFTLPAGLVYLIGCVLSHYRWKYENFASSTSYSHIEASFPSAAAVRLLRFAIGGFVLCAFSVIGGLKEMGIIFLGLGLAGVYLAMRAKKFHALSLHQSYFTVTPGLFVDPLAIPYSSVQEATLYDDESIRFTVDLRKGPPVVLVWSLLRVEKKNRRSALESLGSALAARHVPLY